MKKGEDGNFLTVKKDDADYYDFISDEAKASFSEEYKALMTQQIDIII